MERKIVKHGESTMMVSLPSKWVKKAKLGKGDEVGVEEVGSNLILSPKKSAIKNEKEITITTSAESVVREMIVYAYRLGYNRIKVNFSSENQFRMVQSVMKARLMGFDVIKKEKNYCIIENIAEPMKEQFDNILQKLFMNISEMFEITEQRLSGEQPIEDYELVDERIRQYDSFCRRVVSKYGKENPVLFWNFSIWILHAYRELYHLNIYLNKKKVRASKEILAYLKEVHKGFDMISESYTKKDVSLPVAMHEKEKEMSKKRDSILESAKGPETVIMYHIASCERTVYLSSNSLMGLLQN